MPVIRLRLAAFSAAYLAGWALLAASATGALAQKNMTPAPQIPKSRSATSCPIADPPPPMALIGKTEEAYFKKINAAGGVNGRKINFIGYDDAYSAAKNRRAGAQAGGDRTKFCWCSTRSAHRRTRRSRNT